MSRFVLSARADVSALLAKHEELRNDLLRAAARAVNATATDVRRAAVNEIQTRVPEMPARAIAGYVTVTKAKYRAPRLTKAGALRANYTGISATVKAAGKAPNLIYLVPASKRTPEAFRHTTGVTARVMRKQVTYKGTFIVKTKATGKPIVVSVKDRTKRPKGQSEWRAGWSKGTYGPSMKALAGNQHTWNAMDQVARARWPMHWQRESSRVILAGGV